MSSNLTPAVRKRVRPEGLTLGLPPAAEAPPDADRGKSQKCSRDAIEEARHTGAHWLGAEAAAELPEVAERAGYDHEDGARNDSMLGKPERRAPPPAHDFFDDSTVFLVHVLTVGQPVAESGVTDTSGCNSAHTRSVRSIS